MGQAASSIALAQTVTQGNVPEVLEEIWTPGCAAAVWQRRPDRHFQGWIDALAPDTLPAARMTLSPDHVADAVDAVCERHDMADSTCRKMLAGDIAALATLFARVMEVEMVRLRLDVVNDDACTKFHLDHVPARLLCTYRGRGTEYGPSLAGETPSPISQLATGSVGLFRGRRWPGSEPCGILHRSPPISGSGETRLLLVIDKADAE